MKKLFSLLVVAGMVAIVACGPSAEEKAAAEKKKADSIRVADSIAAAEKQKLIDDSIAAVQKAVEDSIAAATPEKKK
ncbi:MAG TPA: hypothetical protein PLC90_03255 [Bacteroidales bacterium]|nr:hypothetical protein [Bacteroidales bacterium]HPI29687.1 hypothetical protein [Bacteroidales bacterium]HQN15350.1 hypothetical protein [Bacteroidales bacterium]